MGSDRSYEASRQCQCSKNAKRLLNCVNHVKNDCGHQLPFGSGRLLLGPLAIVKSGAVQEQQRRIGRQESIPQPKELRAGQRTAACTISKEPQLMTGLTTHQFVNSSLNNACRYLPICCN